MRITLVALAAFFTLTAAAHADTFNLDHKHSGTIDATAVGTVTFGDNGGATIQLTLSDRSDDGYCARAWVTSNLGGANDKQFQVCGVAQQETHNYALPATSRCNLAWVQVVVGRYDSKSNTTQLGDSKRMNYTCPPVAQPTPVPTVSPVPTATPTPDPGTGTPVPTAPAKVTSLVSYQWVSTTHWTRNTKLTVRDVPSGGTVTVSCRGNGCYKKAKTATVRNGNSDLHRIIKSRHLGVGAVLDVKITAPGMVGKVVRFTMRKHNIPTMQRYCLAEGARHSTRC